MPNITFQTAVYQAVYVDANLGWDYGDILFESRINDDPSRVMI
ncbi:hypothetical protein BH10BAC3_BH10BAC3_11890 [soil metagenome]